MHNTSHTLFPAFAKPCSPEKFWKASALEGFAGTTYEALIWGLPCWAKRPTQPLRHPLEVLSKLGWLSTKIAYLKSLASILWDKQTGRSYKPSFLGKHFCQNSAFGIHHPTLFFCKSYSNSQIWPFCHYLRFHQEKKLFIIKDTHFHLFRYQAWPQI
jgi:hypothetical protein